MLDRLSVGRKLLAGFSAVGVIVLALMSTQFVTVDDLSSASARMTDQASPRAQAAADVRYAAAAMRGAQAVHLADGDQPTQSDFEAAAASFDDSVDRLRDLASFPVERALVAKIASGGRTFQVLDEMILDASRSGDQTKAQNLMLGAEGLDAANIAGDADRFQGLARQEQDAASADFASTAAGSRREVLALGALAVLLVAGCSAMISRAMRGPLTRVQEAAERAASVDLTSEVEVTTNDENGRLAIAFNSMLQNLRAREDEMRGETRRREIDGRLHRALELPAVAADSTERVRTALAAQVAIGGTPPFTASFGVSDTEHSNSFDDLLRQADVAMYQAKEAGRDRIVIAGTMALDSTPENPADQQPRRRLSEVVASGFSDLASVPDPVDPADTAPEPVVPG